MSSEGIELKTNWMGCMWAVGLSLFAPSLPGQVKIGGKELQFHGFMQQGFAVSSGNNFLTMKTTNGSFAMTDGGMNLSMRLTPKLRIGAQAFSRNLGDFGNGKVQLDWAFVDYQFNDAFGIRAGKVKTTLGLFTDTQDMEFVHTWALLPQSVYPTDLRSSTIAHVGGDIYGTVSLRKAGRLNYVAYGGQRPDDKRDGNYLGSSDQGTPISAYRTSAAGGDLRWVTPLEGLTVGYSYFRSFGYGDSRLVLFRGRPVPVPIPYRFNITRGLNQVFYGDFQRGKLRAYAEYMPSDLFFEFTNIPVPSAQNRSLAWYVAGSYRVHPKLELGSYYNAYAVDRTKGFALNNGIRGPVVAARVDINRYWNLKAEAHFIEGYGTPQAAHTFYRSSNPQGFRPRTNVFLLRTGFAF
jgi:hypothetical protein